MSAHLELATYREAGRAPATAEEIRPDRVWTSLSAFVFWLSGVLAVGGIAVARVVAEPQDRFLAVLLAIILLHVCGIGAVVLADRWRWERGFSAWLGGSAVRSPLRLVSEDGLRVHCADLDDPTDSHGSNRGHFEELTADGLVARSCVQRTWAARKAAQMGPTKVARVQPARWQPRCFQGLPWKPDSLAPFEKPVELQVRVVDGGVLLTRFAAGHRFAGETLHETLHHAEAQIEDELGVAALEWCDAPSRGAPDVKRAR